MANWFEDLAKSVGDEKVGRRTVLRRVAGGVVGAALAGAIPGIALAHGSKQCPGGGGNCTVGFSNCNNPNTNCFCFTGTDGLAHCGCNTFCSQASPCSRNKDCGKGGVCITANGCTGCGSSTGVCIPKCHRANKNCQLGSGNGKTTAR